MFIVRENKSTGFFEIAYAGRVVLTFGTLELAKQHADKMNGKTPAQP